MKISVLGAGALGSAIGGTLQEAGAQVTLINRSPAFVAAVRRDGLILRDGGVDRRVAIAAATSCADLAPADLVIVLVKSFHTREAISTAAPIIGPDTLVLSLQNGLGHEDILAEAVGRERVLAGKTYVGGVMLAPGHVIAGVRGKETLIGELAGGISARAERIAAFFSAAGLTTHVSADIVATIWDKLLINVATGALSAITRLTYGDLYAVPELRDTALAAVAEAMAVAQARGVRLGISVPQQAWDKAGAGLPPEFKASMLQSLEKGSLTEIDYINGAVVRCGAQCGVATPVNAALVACVKGIERRLLHDGGQLPAPTASSGVPS